MSLSTSPLRLPVFRRLLAAYTINATGDWLGQVTLSLLVLRSTGSVLAVTVFWTLGRFVPTLVVPALLGRVQRRFGTRLLTGAYAVEAVVFATVALAAALRLPVTVLLALAVLDGVLGVTARSLTKATIVCATRPVGLHAPANVLLNIAFTVSFAAGPALAGVLVSDWGAPFVLALDAVSFLVAAVALSYRTAMPNLQPPEEAKLTSLRHTVREFTANERLRKLLVTDSLANIFFSLIIPVELVFVTRTLHASPAAFGTVLAAWGLGAVLGGSLLVRLRAISSGALVSGSYVVMIVSYLGMGGSTSIYTVVAFSFLGGIGNGIEGCSMLTALQEHVPDHAQASLNSLIEALHAALPGLGFLLGGLIAALASPRVSYLTAGLGALAVLIACPLWRPGRRVSHTTSTACAR